MTDPDSAPLTVVGLPDCRPRGELALPQLRWRLPQTGGGTPLGKNKGLSARRSRDTHPELLIRRSLYRRGLRYRVNYPVPGSRRRTMDIAFPRRRIAVFIDGCYWHGCPLHFRSPQTNTEFWLHKISRNRDRDSDTNSRLREAGWVVMRFWEHQESDQAARAIFAAVMNHAEMALEETR